MTSTRMKVRNVKRNRRAAVEDRWTKTIRGERGDPKTVPSANYGKGSR